MSRERKPPHLIKKRGRLLQDGTVRIWWLIKDGNYQKRTGCLEHQVTQAEKALAEYIAEKHEPAAAHGKSSEVPIADVLNVYFSYKVSCVPRPKELAASIKRLNDYWGGKKELERTYLHHHPNYQTSIVNMRLMGNGKTASKT